MAGLPPGGKKRITLQSLESDGVRVTAMCGETLEDTRELVGRKLGFSSPASCRLFNKYGAEIDHIDLVLHDDLLYASTGADFPTSRTASRGMPGMVAMSQGGEQHPTRSPPPCPSTPVSCHPRLLAVSCC